VGKHLHRDCPSQAEKKEPEKPNAEPAKPALSLEGLQNIQGLSVGWRVTDVTVM
jgi:hypothetical protein